MPVRRQRPPPLSFAQQRLWFLDRLAPGGATYNIPSAVLAEGALDAAALARALTEVSRLHEALRTVFREVGGQPVQVVRPPRPVPLPVVDLSALPPAARSPQVRRLASREAGRPFDLACGPLLRARLLTLAARERVLLLNLHYMVADEWSVGVLVREVSALYEAFRRGEPSPLPELAVQYPTSPSGSAPGSPAAGTAARLLATAVRRGAGPPRAAHRPAAPAGAELPRCPPTLSLAGGADGGAGGAVPPRDRDPVHGADGGLRRPPPPLQRPERPGGGHPCAAIAEALSERTIAVVVTPGRAR